MALFDRALPALPRCETRLLLPPFGLQLVLDTAPRLTALESLSTQLAFNTSGDVARFCVEVGPLGDNAHGRLELGLLGERVVAEIDRLGLWLDLIRAPRLAPQPLLRERLDGNLR